MGSVCPVAAGKFQHVLYKRLRAVLPHGAFYVICNPASGQKPSCVTQIHNKGFNMSGAAGLNAEGRLDYSKIKVGPKTLDDAVLTLGALPKSNKMYARKDQVVMALATNNISKLREIS